MKSKIPHTIFYPAQFLREEYGSGWKRRDHLEVKGVPTLLMSLFQASNHCTLTSLTALFAFYRQQGFTLIPRDIQTLFSMIEFLALRGHLYHPRFGTFPWNMDELALRVWRQCGYEGHAKNRWFFAKQRHLDCFLLQEIQAERPGMISMTGLPYPAHSVTYYGIEIWEKENQQKCFLLVDDHWNDRKRYIDTAWLGEGAGTYFSLCLVRP